MRITNLTMTRNYRTGLNNAQARLYEANMKAGSGDRMTAMNEDVARGLRAFKVRRELQKTDTYIDNVKEVQTFYKSAEDYISGIVENGRKVSELYVQALNKGVNSPDEYSAIAAQITRIQEDLLTNLNARFSDRYHFGGTKSNMAPFAVDGAGDLTYSYKNADGIYQTMKVKDISRDDPDCADIFNDPSFIDIGLGFELNGTQEMIPSTVFDRAFNGLNIIGFGEDNMYDLMSKVLTTLKDGKPDEELLNKMNTSYKDAAVQLTKIGAEVQFLDYSLERLTNERVNLITRQDSLEKIPLEEAATEWKMREYLYNAALQMGTTLLQPSLFSFLR